MKDLKNLKGAKVLRKMEQKDIKGGRPLYVCNSEGPIVACVSPELCAIRPDGTYYCIK